MSREAVVRYFLVYSAVAVVLALLWTLATPGMADWRWAAIIGHFLGAIVSLFLLPGILPAIYWAFGRFRAEKAGGPLSVWSALAVAFIPLATVGDFYDGTIQPKQIPANISALFSNDYETFIRVVKTSCVESRNRNSTNRQTGLSDAAFAAFCQCYAEALLKDLTIQEFRIALDARAVVNPPPAWMREKTGRAAIACRSFAVSP
jgi:hypothetical protein